MVGADEANGSRFGLPPQTLLNESDGLYCGGYKKGFTMRR